jgi:hypothetical protein
MPFSPFHAILAVPIECADGQGHRRAQITPSKTPGIYWGKRIWTDYGSELSRRASDI